MSLSRKIISFGCRVKNRADPRSPSLCHRPISPFLKGSAPEKAARSDWQVVNTKILPQPQYAKLCQDGADSISPEFGECYLKSTFLADGSPFGT